MRKNVAVLVVLVACLAAGVAGADIVFTPLTFPDARSAALGGTHVALADDISVLVTNPAGFQAAGPQFIAADITANLSGPVFSIADLVMKIMGGADPTTLISDPDVQKLLTSLYASAVLNGPLALGYVGNGLGFGFFNSSGLTFTTVGTIPTMTAAVQENLEFVAGYSFRVPLPAEAQSTLDLGLSVKAFTSGSVEVSESILNMISILSSGDISSLLSQPFNLDVGFGIDSGIRYSWNDTIAVGVVGRNLFAPVVRNTYSSIMGFSGGETPVQSYGYEPIDLSAGIMYSPHFEFLDRYISSLKLMLDYNDILDFLTHPSTATNPILHVSAGVEITMLQILALRGGFGDGYFAAGLGLNLTAFRFNVSMYGSELSTEPGLRPAYNLLVGMQYIY
ncbi:MAG TPA: hypothetical protein VHE79_07160 [Spirochaetia bacterium]